MTNNQLKLGPSDNIDVTVTVNFTYKENDPEDKARVEVRKQLILDSVLSDIKILLKKYEDNSSDKKKESIYTPRLELIDD